MELTQTETKMSELAIGDQHENHEEHREITIETLAAPPVDVKSAPLARRATAAIIDSLIVLAAWSVMEDVAGANLVTKAYLLTDPLGSFNLMLPLHLAILTFAYYSVMEGLFAATFGKMIVKIRVLGSDGDPCSFSASVTRNAVRFIDWLPLLYALGAVAVLASPKKQRIGDRVAKTIVSPIKEKDINPPPAPFLFH